AVHTTVTRVLEGTFGVAAQARRVGLAGIAATGLTPRLAAAAADGCHVLAVPTHRHAALAARLAGFAGIEFVRGAFGVRRTATLARDLALLRAVHRREAAVAPRTRLRVRRPAGASVIARVVSLSAAIANTTRRRDAIVVARSVRHPAPPKYWLIESWTFSPIRACG